MKIVVTGASGLVGRPLTEALRAQGHQVETLSHGRDWDPETGRIQKDKLEGADAVIHLAGENVGSGRWTESKKRVIRDSRVKGTQLLCKTLCELARPPKVLVCAAATGFYGNSGDAVMTEASGLGQGFLAEVGRDWEAACAPARDKGIRVVNLRLGVVLAKGEGALGKMLTPFRFGLGGVVGPGTQWMSWITLEDAIAGFLFALKLDTLRGPVNLVAPGAVTNRQFTKTLGGVLHRPTVLPLPAFAVKLMLGEMGEALLLSSCRVQPVVLQKAGFQFRHPELEGALRSVLAG